MSGSPDFRQTFRNVDYLRLEIGLPHPTAPNIVRQDAELGAYGWVTPVPNTAIAAYGNGNFPPGFTGPTWTGGYKLTTASMISTDVLEFSTEAFPMVAGQWAASSVGVNIINGSTATGVQVKTEFLNASRAVVGASAYTGAFGGPAGAQQPAVTQAPTGTAWVRIVIKVLRSATGTRDLFFSEANIVTASTSSAAAAGVATYRAYVDSWVNVIAPTHSIDIKRHEIDPGTLAARVLDATIDPAVSTLIRPGRPCRLTVANGFVWEPLFTGTLTEAVVQYDLERSARGDNRHAQITLSAVDNVTTLASRRMPYGVGEIAHLRSVLEESGVPWNVNGSRNQLSEVIPAVSVNDNATMLDQVVTTRDTAAGFAWVDRRGVLNAFDQATLDAVTLFGKQNLILNPSFEVNAANWGQNGGAIDRQTDSTTPFGIACCRYISSTHAAGNSAAYSSAGTVTAGTEYAGSAWVKMQGQASAYRLVLHWYTSGGTVPVYPSTLGAQVPASALSGTEFRRISVNGVAPATADAVRLGIAPVSALTSGNGFRFDGAMVTEGPEQLAFFEGTVQQSFSERQYADIDLNFTTKRLINEVSIKSIEWDPGDPSKSIEVMYGPYRDEASIREWGPARSEFTVNGLTPTEIGNLALSILIRNNTPRVCANSIKVPILTPYHINQRAFLDLYNRVTVGFEPKRFNRLHRITGIGHSITEKGWVMELEFATEDSVALPQVTAGLFR